MDKKGWKPLLAVTMALLVTVGSWNLPWTLNVHAESNSEVFTDGSTEEILTEQQTEPQQTEKETRQSEPTTEQDIILEDTDEITDAQSQPQSESQTESPVDVSDSSQIAESEPSEDDSAKVVTGWNWINGDELEIQQDEETGTWGLGLPGVNTDNQADFDTMVSLLPATIEAAIQDAEQTEELAITWSCDNYVQDENGNWPVSGTYTFSGNLPDGYVMGNSGNTINVDIELGGADTYTLTQDTDGYYKISTSDDLLNFSYRVNDGEASINAKLMNDIDMSGLDYGRLMANAYKGIFNGNGFTIKNVLINVNGGVEGETGLFAYTEGATIKNLGVTGEVLGGDSVGGIVGYAIKNTRIENCWNGADVNAVKENAGGIVGWLQDSTVTNCYNLGKITAAKDYGGIVGTLWTGGSVTNCLNLGQVPDPIAGYGGTWQNCDNCYFLDTNSNETEAGMSKNFIEIQNGSVAYWLNGTNAGTDSGVWKQTIGTDSHPSFNGKIVYQNSDGAFYNIVAEYTVSVTAPANITRDGTSGNATQSVKEDSTINTITYQADAGYCFPADYASLGTTNGIVVNRTDDTTITVSGKPTANTNITLAAPTSILTSLPEAGVDIANGTITVSPAKEANFNVIQYKNAIYKVANTETITVTGTTTENQVVVKDGAVTSINLSNATIDVSGKTNMAAIDMSTAGACTITMQNGTTNTLKAGYDSPGIYVPKDVLVTLQGGGILNVTGGHAWPAIGRAVDANICIKSGVITAHGGTNAAGIGGSWGWNFKAVSIEGGTVTTIGDNTYGIGKGYGNTDSDGTVSITGGSVNAGSIGAQPTSNGTTKVYLTTIILDGESAGTAVSSITGTTYSTTGMQTNDSIYEVNTQIEFDGTALESGDSISNFISNYGESTNALYIRVKAVENGPGASVFLPIGISRAAAPNSVSKIGATASSISFTSYSGWEYKMESGSWQSSNTFTGLSAGKTYNFAVRTKATSWSFASDEQILSNVSTEQASYTVSIPKTTAKVPDKGTSSIGNISLTEDAAHAFDLGNNGKVKVSVSSGTDADGKITLIRDQDTNTKITSLLSTNGSPCIRNKVLTTYTTTNKTQTVPLTLTAPEYAGTTIPAGTYNGIVVFGITYSEN